MEFYSLLQRFFACSFILSFLGLPGKKVNGRKRFIMVDILGLVFGAMVCPANIGERAGAMRLLESLKYPLSRLQKILVDKGFSGEDITQWA